MWRLTSGMIKQESMGSKRESLEIKTKLKLYYLDPDI